MQAKGYEKLFNKFNNGKRNIFLVVCVFSIVGYIIDFEIFNSIYSNIQKAYHILCMLICLFSLLIFFLKKNKDVSLYFNLISYSAIINIFVSHIFFQPYIEAQQGGASFTLSRDAFFIMCYISLSGFISHSRHIIIQGSILIALILYYLIIFKSPFYIENGPVYILVTVGLCVVMYFFTSVVKDSLKNLNQANSELTEANQELFAQREELESTLNLLEETQDQLIRSEKMASLGILAAGVAHEINNPLNFIQGGLYGLEQYFEDHLKDHIEEVNPLINGIKQGVKRSADIVTSLNHFSRQGNSDNEICNIHEIIESCLIMLQNQLKYKAEIIKNFTVNSFTLLGNEGKLHQVFLNILSNASQAITEKGVIKITTKLSNTNLVISIEDSGTGIHTDDLSKITDPFYTTKDAGKGVGLGLSIAYNIIKDHKGTIDFNSENGKGTEVVVELPVQI